MQKNTHNLGVLFFDPVSTAKNEMFRKIYSELYENGDFIDSYSFIKDSLNIENSHHSVGIQIADFISGAFSALLKSNPKVDYSRGTKMFFDSVYPNLRRNWDTGVHGYGIREVPRNRINRKWQINQIKINKP